MSSDWKRYIDYLHKWADDHEAEEFEGCCPDCFEEFLDAEEEYNDDDNEE